MTGLPRMPRDNDPRRPLRREQDDIEEFEDLTDEPVREGKDEPDSGPSPADRKKERDLREFEDLAGEPVFDDEDKPNS